MYTIFPFKSVTQSVSALRLNSIPRAYLEVAYIFKGIRLRPAVEGSETSGRCSSYTRESAINSAIVCVVVAGVMPVSSAISVRDMEGLR